MRSNFHSRDFSDRNLGNAVINHMLTASANFTLSGPRLPTYISPSLPRLPRLVSGAPHKDFRPGNRPAPNAKHVAMVKPESVDLECTLAFHLTCMTKTQFRLGVAAIFTAIPLHNLTSPSRYTVAKDQPLLVDGATGKVWRATGRYWKLIEL